ncbi:unnamed protein product [Arctia plantaginis]|uniref:Uncharacterized protein n=1 Tax=Arctia plantaginis TaxID=874455 RepID=A0A8S0ZNQ3_ARCPL|nr:unnamed protein product [Arctia plantaginis]
MMTQSPKKYVSNYTNCTSHRGVEAKDVELANPQLDLTTSHSSNFRADSSADREPSSEAPAPPPTFAASAPDDTASYLQVVVEKHRRRREVRARPAQTSPRLPSASSPLARVHPPQVSGGGDRGVYVLPHSVLLACPTASPLCRALNAHNYNTRGALVDVATCARSSCSLAPRDGAGAGAGDIQHGEHGVQKKNNPWKIFRGINSDLYDNEPERVEVYYFEQGAGSFLATSDGGRVTWCERAARRPERVARALLAELSSAATLLGGAPVALLLGVQRAALVLVRGAVTGAVQTTSDYALKPALALLYNALVQPVLVFACNVARGVRSVLRPLSAAMSEAVEPVARVLSAVRLVDVRLACSCPHCAQSRPCEAGH